MNDIKDQFYTHLNKTKPHIKMLPRPGSFGILNDILGEQ